MKKEFKIGDIVYISNTKWTGGYNQEFKILEKKVVSIQKEFLETNEGLKISNVYYKFHGNESRISEAVFNSLEEAKEKRKQDIIQYISYVEGKKKEEEARFIRSQKEDEETLSNLREQLISFSV